MRVEIVATQDVDRIWGETGIEIVKCLEKTPSYTSAGELWQACRSGQMFLLVAHDGEKIHCTSIWAFEHGFGRDVFNCVLLVGKNPKSWLSALVEKSSEIARAGGATAIVAGGRVGLERMIKREFKRLKIVRQSLMLEL